MVRLSMLSPTSQVAILEFLVSFTFWTLPLFDSHLILGVPGAVQGCQEIKAIMAFSFLLWIMRTSFPLSVYAPF